MSKPPASRHKTISPLILEDGFVYGWAYDPLRPVLNVSLSIDGQPPVTVGATGFAVADSFYAVAVPPRPDAGFCLPVPAAVMDGFMHTFEVRVQQWQHTPNSLKAELDWYFGPCFGEVSNTDQGMLEGWVGFREALTPESLPTVLIQEAGLGKLAIQLTMDLSRRIQGAHTLTRFRISKVQLSGLASPTFSCQGVPLRIKNNDSSAIYKVVGNVERADHRGLRGWLVNMSRPLESLDVVLIIDGLPHAVYRPNLRGLDVARQLNLLPEEVGLCAFDIGLPLSVQDGAVHSLELRCKADGTLLNEHPITYQHPKPGMPIAEARRLLQLPPLPAQAQTRRKSLRKAAPKVAVIILNRNGAACLDGLFASFSKHNSVPVEFIVIDHASTDTSAGVLQKWRASLPIRIQALQENRSFSASCNHGARLAKAPNLLFLNNDIVWVQDALPAMLTSLNKTNVGAVGLRLLKTTHDAAVSREPQVQHLGVRFTLVGEQYWPFELTPETTPLDGQYSPLTLPAVTAAVMLCKKSVFDTSGGFDEAYFYGYEDVEFCLRLSQHLGKTLISRNDLTALHHHGYTRLTGREPGMMQHQITNQARLAETHGLWLKRQCWLDLVSGTQGLTVDIFTVGLAINAPGSESGQEQLALATDLASDIALAHPHARVLILNAAEQWNQVSELNLLITLSPAYDLRSMQQARADLRTAVYIEAQATIDPWQVNPGTSMFDLCLYRGSATLKRKLAALPLPTALSTAAAPLGTLTSAPLRVTIRACAATLDAAAVSYLSTSLKQAGLGVFHESIDKSQKSRTSLPPKVAEVVITILDHALFDEIPAYTYRRQSDVINVLWELDSLDHLRRVDLALPDLIWHAQATLPESMQPKARTYKQVQASASSMRGLASLLRKKVDQKIGRTFSSS